MPNTKHLPFGALSFAGFITGASVAVAIMISVGVDVGLGVLVGCGV